MADHLPALRHDGTIESSSGESNRREDDPMTPAPTRKPPRAALGVLAAVAMMSSVGSPLSTQPIPPTQEPPTDDRIYLAKAEAKRRRKAARRLRHGC